jgi:hypothetical protein
MNSQPANSRKWENVRRKAGIAGPSESYCAHFSVLIQYDGQDPSGED